MKKIYSSLLITLFLLQSTAMAGSQTIKSILDDYSFAMEVQWDQSNEQEQKLIEEKFADSLEQYLATHSGELLVHELVISLDAEAQAQVLPALRHSSSPEELQQRLLEAYQKSQAQGVNWSGAGKVAVGAVGVLALTYLAFRIYMHEWGKRL